MSDTIFELKDFEPEPVYTGRAPLGFTMDYFTPDELIEAHAFAGRGRHTWESAITLGLCGFAPGHSIHVLSVDLRCRCAFPYLTSEWEKIGPCQCVGDYLFQANCVECRWHVIGSERDAVELWHDHAWPGWRDLPILPADLAPHGGGLGSHAMDKAGAKRARAWVTANYPPEWQVSGAPVRTERRPMGTRHVPGYSPWDGFDLCAAVRDYAEVAA